jgi:hypothetical protein
LRIFSDSIRNSQSAIRNPFGASTRPADPWLRDGALDQERTEGALACVVQDDAVDRAV